MPSPGGPPDAAPPGESAAAGAGGVAPGRGLSTLLRHSLTYSAAPLAARVVGFLVSLKMAEWLGTARYGLGEIADMILVALTQALGQNLLGGMTRFYFEQRTERERRALVSTITLLVGGAAWLVCGAIFVLRSDLTILLARGGGDVPPAQLPGILGLTVLIVPFQLTTQAGYNFLQIQQRSGTSTRIQLVKLVLEAGLKLWMVGWLGLGVRGMLLSVLVGEALTTFGLGGWMLARVGLRFDWAVFRPALVYTLPLIPVGLIQLGIHQIDRRLLEALSPRGPGLALEAVGVYGFGYKIGNLVNAILIGPFLQIWHPWLFAERDLNERARLLARVTTYAALVFGAAALGQILFGRELVRLVDFSGSFDAAWHVVPWIAAGYVCWGVYQVASTALYAAKRTGRLVALNAAALAFNVAANVVLIPRLDELGAAVATMLTYGLVALLVVRAGRIATGARFEMGRLTAVLCCVFAGGAAAWWIDRPHPGSLLDSHWTASGLKLALLALLLAVLWRGVVSADERARLVDWVRRWRSSRSARDRR